MTESEFQRLCEKAMQENNDEEAMALCDDFITEHPTSPRGFRKRAALFARRNHLEKAIKDIGVAIDFAPDEASFYFFRGWWKLESGEFAEAEFDQSTAIQLETEKEADFVLESAYFFRALARLFLQKYHEASNDIALVRDDFIIHLRGIGEVTKQRVVADVERQTR